MSQRCGFFGGPILGRITTLDTVVGCPIHTHKQTGLDASLLLGGVIQNESVILNRQNHILHIRFQRTLCFVRCFCPGLSFVCFRCTQHNKLAEQNEDCKEGLRETVALLKSH